MPRFQLKFSKQICTCTYSKPLPVCILIKTVRITEIKCLTLKHFPPCFSETVFSFCLYFLPSCSLVVRHDIKDCWTLAPVEHSWRDSVGFRPASQLRSLPRNITLYVGTVTNAMFTLYRIVSAPAHKNGDFGAISMTETS